MLHFPVSVLLHRAGKSHGHTTMLPKVILDACKPSPTSSLPDARSATIHHRSELDPRGQPGESVYGGVNTVYQGAPCLSIWSSATCAPVHGVISVFARGLDVASGVLKL